LAYLLSNGESVFEFLHAGLQFLDFAPLFFQEQIFDTLKSCRGLVVQTS